MQVKQEDEAEDTVKGTIQVVLNILNETEMASELKNKKESEESATEALESQGKESEALHLFVKEFVLDPQETPVIGSEKRMLCCICYQPVPQSTIQLPGCGHLYCAECFKHYAKWNGRFGGATSWYNSNRCATGNRSSSHVRIRIPLKCTASHCSRLIPFQMLRVTLSEFEFSEYIKGLFAWFILRHNNEFRFCPSPDCSKVYKVDSGPFFCSSCNKKICTRCHIVYHENLTCRQYQTKSKSDVDFSDWIKKADAKTCPRCLSLIEKNGGCSHMFCPICGENFCWNCRKSYDPHRGHIC